MTVAEFETTHLDWVESDSKLSHAQAEALSIKPDILTVTAHQFSSCSSLSSI